MKRKTQRESITVEADFSLADAKRLMRKLIEDPGGCDVFLDHREPDGLHEATAFDIRDFVRDCITVQHVPAGEKS